MHPPANHLPLVGTLSVTALNAQRVMPGVVPISNCESHTEGTRMPWQFHDAGTKMKQMIALFVLGSQFVDSPADSPHF